VGTERNVKSPANNPAPRVAVVIPVYNYAGFVADAVHSAASQGDMIAEIIVVDDGSTDGTLEIVRELKEPRLRVIAQPNEGPAAARNTGWHAARADWIHFLDADDMLEPGATAALLEVAEQQPGRIPFGIQTVYPPDMCSGPTFTAQLAARSGWLIDELCIYYYASIFTALLPRRALQAIGGFSGQVRNNEDYDFAMRLADKFEFAYVSKPVYRTRMHGENRHRGFRADSAERRLDIVRNNLGKGAGLGARYRYHRAMAHSLWRAAQDALRFRDRKAARGLFLRSLCHQPTKLAAWRGWLNCWLALADEPTT
jgi:glycosyltransferase involved in cell wall biosynthesis